MSFPDRFEEDPAEIRPEIEWGVPRDPKPPVRSPAGRLIWIVLSILIILSLVLPWILPYLFPRRVPLRDDGSQAMRIWDITSEQSSDVISHFPSLFG
ncbi:MAG TPA: hypothetical protein VMN57_14700 [Anaerolineales bacterium]|nr:hypothetical protein [Anaerolineales bacterium]